MSDPVCDFLSAQINESGVSDGNGISVSDKATGDFTLSFEEGYFDGPPAIIITPVYPSPSFRPGKDFRAVVMSTSQTGCRVQISKGGDPINCPFTVLAMRAADSESADPRPNTFVGQSDYDSDRTGDAGAWINPIDGGVINGTYVSSDEGRPSWNALSSKFDGSPGDKFPVLLQARTSDESIVTELRGFSAVDSESTDVNGATFKPTSIPGRLDYQDKRIHWVMSNQTNFDAYFTRDDGRVIYAVYSAGVVDMGNSTSTSGGDWVAHDIGGNRILVQFTDNTASVSPSGTPFSSDPARPAVRVVGSGEDQAVLTYVSDSTSKPSFVVRIEKDDDDGYPPFCFVRAGVLIR